MKHRISAIALLQFFLIVFFSMGTLAQERCEPFIQKGKRWHVFQFHSWGEYHDTPLVYDCTFTDETAEKNDGTYTKMLVCYSNGVNSEYWFREEGKRVYCFNETINKGVLQFDFSLQVGDTVDNNDVTYDVTDRTLIKDGTDRLKTKITLRPRDKSNNYPEEEWIEGMGNANTPLLSFPKSMISSHGDYVVYVHDSISNSFSTIDFALPSNKWWGCRAKSIIMKLFANAEKPNSLRYHLIGDTLCVDGWLAVNSPFIYAYCRQTGKDSLQILFATREQTEDSTSTYQVHFAFPKMIESKYTINDPYKVSLVEKDNHKYLPTFTKGKQWINNGPGPIWETGRDTVIGGMKYYNIIIHWGEDSYNGAYVREENGKIYKYSIPHDIVVFDYTLNVGDTILVNEENETFEELYAFRYAVVKNVYNTIIQKSTDKQVRRCIYLESIILDNMKDFYYSDQDTWVEGIGSLTHGLSATRFGITGWLGMQKVFLGDTIYYAGGPLTPVAYLPTIESNKIWETVQSDYRYYIGKKVTLNETEYTEFFREFSDKDGKPAIQESCEYVREADGKVYKYDEGSGSEYLLLDYTLKKGDTIQVCSKGNVVKHEAVVTKTYTTFFDSSTDKKMRRCIEIQSLDDETLTDIWIEGIGSLYYALGDIMSGATGCPPIKRVTVGDNVLYDESAQLGIVSVHSRRTSAQDIHSLDGRRLQQVPEKGVYIVNGRKMVRK